MTETECARTRNKNAAMEKKYDRSRANSEASEGRFFGLASSSSPVPLNGLIERVLRLCWTTAGCVTPWAGPGLATDGSANRNERHPLALGR